MNRSLYLLLSKCFIALATLSTVLICFQIEKLAGSDLVDHYPFMWPDSFDWIVNATYYLDTFFYQTEVSDPTIRPPLLTAIIALSLLLKIPLAPLILTQVVFLLSYLLIYRSARLLGMSHYFTALLLGSLLLHHAYNGFRLYLMADPLITFLSITSMWFFLKHLVRPKNKVAFYAGAFFSGLASLGQFFGAFPAVCFALYQCLSAVKRRQWSALKWAAFSLVPALAFQLIWLGFKEVHFGSYAKTSVSNFKYLQLSLGNAEFYLEVWPILFAPILFAFLCWLPAIRRPAGQPMFRNTDYYLMLLSGCFLFSVFFYQWKEARFSTFLLPVVYLTLLLMLSRLLSRKIAGARAEVWRILVLLGAFVLSVTPTNDLMQPKVANYFQSLKDFPNSLKHHSLSTLYQKAPENRFASDCLIFPADQDFIYVRGGCYRYLYQNVASYLSHQRRVEALEQESR